jgi:uncharacterized iron-regulated membrane protein
VLAVYGQQQLSFALWLEVLLRPLHFGDFAHLTSRLIWFVFGALLTSLVCSGMVIWCKRTAAASKSARSTQQGLSALGWRAYLFKVNGVIFAALIGWGLYVIIIP